MKSKIKYIILILVIILILAIGTIIKINIDINKKNQELPTTADTKQTEENVLVVGIEKKEKTEDTENTEKAQSQTEQNTSNNKTKEELQPEPERDASTLTQEIYNMNTTIGTINIPKTKIKLQVYSNSDPKKMEKMPAFLYTSGGLNENGITLLVGHNKRNGKIFSNNKKLAEGDVFYFTDYQGREKKYTIYSKFTTTADDTAFLNGDFNSPVMALSCCTDASDDNRIIILGRAE